MIKKYWFIVLLLFIEGSSLMAVELMSAKLLAPFYGSSLYVWTSVLTLTLLGLTLGYYTGGYLSLKKANEFKLVLIIAFAALLVFVLPYTASVAISISSGLELIPGVITAALLVIVPPVFCFGMVGPLVVRLLTQKVETLGNVAGTVYFISTFGGIAATFLFGFYLIPNAGLRLGSLITALALAFVVILYFVKSAFAAKEVSFSEEQVPELSKKAKVAKSTKNAFKDQGGIKRTVYLFALLEGATVMAVQLISARMLAPWFGSSLFVWGAVIGITLVSLALGYYTGGLIADKFPRLSTLYWVMLAASVFLMFMHYFSQAFTLAFAQLDIYTSVILVSLLLLLPPLVFMGMIPTLLIRYITRNIDNAGSVTGRVFTLSSAGGILSLPLVGFVIIPLFGISLPSIIIALLLGIIPFVKLLSQKNYLALVFVPVFFISLSLTTKARTSPDFSIQYYSEGLLGQVLVADVFKNGAGKPVNNRLLFINRMGQTNVDRSTFRSQWNYITFATAAASKLPENSEALVLGLGGGSMANSLARMKFKVTAVELDERIKAVAQQYFLLDPQVHLVVDDARHYLETTKKTYNLIFFDVFIGDANPPHLVSLECFEKAKSLLNTNGLIIINFNGFLASDAGKAGRSVYKTLKAAGLETKILPTPGAEEDRNSLFIATKVEQRFDSLRSPLLHNGREVGLDSLFYNLRGLNRNDEVIFTDNKSNLENINAANSKTWRKSYNETFTRFLLDNGFPLYN